MCLKAGLLRQYVMPARVCIDRGHSGHLYGDMVDTNAGCWTPERRVPGCRGRSSRVWSCEKSLCGLPVRKASRSGRCVPSTRSVRPRGTSGSRGPGKAIPTGLPISAGVPTPRRVRPRGGSADRGPARPAPQLGRAQAAPPAGGRRRRGGARPQHDHRHPAAARAARCRA